MNKVVMMLLMLLAVRGISVKADDFVMGADISWATQMEERGQKLYNYRGEERECTALMKEMGLTAVRLRVWVNPQDARNEKGEPVNEKYCDKNDVLQKALRAKALGMDVMIDFHYSDWWADPGKQNIPLAWSKHKYKQLLVDVAEHTKDVLALLKDNGVVVRWVQVGNETSNGMMWPVGQLDINPKQYAGLFKAGYDAVKEVMPEAKVIVHLDNGYDNALYNRNLDALRDNGAQWDIIGMSLYPYWSAKVEPMAQRLMAECVRNVRSVSKKYGTDVMLVETGFEVDEKEPWKMTMGRAQLAELIRLCKTEMGGHCRGIFYWEPECRPRGYRLGAFDSDGKPTEIMRAFTVAAGKYEGYDRRRLLFETTAGQFMVELYNETPLHRDNYLKLAEKHLLDSTLIHRVMSNFMIQGGDPTSKNADLTTSADPATPLGNESVTDEKGEKYTIPAEIVLPRFFHKRGALCAARDGDETNPEHRSSSSQYYIVWGKWPVARKAGSDEEPLGYYTNDMLPGVPYLDGAYTVFGEVIEGLSVIEKIQKVRTDSYNRPIDDIRLLKVSVVE